MPEPSGLAAFAGEVCPGIFRFTMHDDRIDFESDSYIVVESGRVTLLDPLPIEDRERVQNLSASAILPPSV